MVFSEIVALGDFRRVINQDKSCIRGFKVNFKKEIILRCVGGGWGCRILVYEEISIICIRNGIDKKNTRIGKFRRLSHIL